MQRAPCNGLSSERLQEHCCNICKIEQIFSHRLSSFSLPKQKWSQSQLCDQNKESIRTDLEDHHLSGCWKQRPSQRSFACLRPCWWWHPYPQMSDSYGSTTKLSSLRMPAPVWLTLGKASTWRVWSWSCHASSMKWMVTDKYDFWWLSSVQMSIVKAAHRPQLKWYWTFDSRTFFVDSHLIFKDLLTVTWTGSKSLILIGFLEATPISSTFCSREQNPCPKTIENGRMSNAHISPNDHVISRFCPLLVGMILALA